MSLLVQTYLIKVDVFEKCLLILSMGYLVSMNFGDNGAHTKHSDHPKDGKRGLRIAR